MKKNLYIAYVTTDRFSRFHSSTPDYSNFSIIGEMTKEEADEYMWEWEQSEAPELPYEECSKCHGMGIIEDEDGEHECHNCDDGYIPEEDWSDHVGRTVSGYLEVYDPKKHFEVASEFPEHLEYKRKCDIKKLEQVINFNTARIDDELEELARLRKSIEKRNEAIQQAKEQLEELK